MISTWAVPTPAPATSWIVPEPEEMLETADAVVLARVSQLRSVARPDGSGIMTEVTLDVYEGYKGAVAGDRLVLQEVGGEVADTRQWIIGSPEYSVGETVLAYVEQDRRGALRTHHLGLGKVDAEIGRDGRIWLSRIRKQGLGRHRETLGRFQRRLPLGAARAPRVTNRKARLEGIAQAATDFRLLSPPSRWFEMPVKVWSDLVGDSKLGRAASSRTVRAGIDAWNGAPGADLELGHQGEQSPSGFQCNSLGGITVSFDDPDDQISDPSGCTGVLAVGGFCSRPGSPYWDIYSGAIVFNNGWDGCRYWQETNVSETATHELGHALGLAHSAQGSSSAPYLRAATMYWTAHFDDRGAVLADYDRDAIAWLYEGTGSAPTPTPAPSPTPSPANPDDLDGDGVDDDVDNCPASPNPGQSDADGDGFGDACDSCADTPNPDQTESCSTLSAKVKLIHRKAKGLTRLSIRGRFAPADNLRSTDDIRFELAGDTAVYEFDIPAGQMRASADGKSARYTDGEVTVTVRRTRKQTQVSLTAKGKDPDLAALVGEASVSLRVVLPGYSASDRASCNTRHYRRRDMMRCTTTP